MLDVNKKLVEALDIVELLKTQGSEQSLFTGLEFLRSVQMRTSALVPGCIPDGNDLPTQTQLQTYSLAMMVELAEFVQELPWKPWKKNPKPLDPERVADEFADILAFMGILIEYLDRMGITPEDLARAYNKKTEVNVQRFLGDY